MLSVGAIASNGLHPSTFRPHLRRQTEDGRLSFCTSSVVLHGNGRSSKINSSSLSTDFQQSMGFNDDDDGGPPRWFSPAKIASRLKGAPLLLFLPGIDGSGLGLKLFHPFLCFACMKDFRRTMLAHSCCRSNTTSRFFALFPSLDRVQCPVLPFSSVFLDVVDLLKLVGESLGASLALLVAAKNPDIDFVLILANPATNFSKSLVQSFVPLSNMFHNKRNAGLLYWTSSTPVETVLWKMKIIQEMQTYLDSHLHAVKAQTLILTSGKDMVLTSITEGDRLSSMLQNSQTHSFISNGDPLFSDDKFDLVAAIKCAGYYRRGAPANYITDFLEPSPSELKSVCETFRWMDVAVDPVMLSTAGGKVVRGLAGIPLEGPVLFVSNHMMLGLDLVPLLSRFWLEQNIKLRTIAHPAFFERMMDGKIQDLPQFDLVRMTGGVPVSAKGLYRLLKSKSHVLLYPGGLREVFHRRGEEHKLVWPVEPEFVRTAARFGAKIVPFGTVGEDDVLQLLFDSDDQMKIPPLKALIEDLTNEAPRVRSDDEGEIGRQFFYCPVALPRLPGRFYFFFGEPISTQGRKDVLTDKDKARELYLEVKTETEKCIEYLKDRREKDPYRSLLARLAYQSFHGFGSLVPTFEI